MTRIARDQIANLVMGVLIVHGGLNERSKRALLEIARLYGLSADEILRILERVARLEHGATVRPIVSTEPIAAGDDEEERSQAMIEEDAARRSFRVVLGVLTALLYASSVVMLALTFITVSRTPPEADQPAEALVTPPRAAAVAPGADRPAIPTRATPADPGEYDALLGPFDDAADRFRANGSDAMARIALSLDTLAQTWPSLDPATVESAAARIANLLIELEGIDDGTHARRLLEIILAPSAHLASGASNNATVAPARVIQSAWSLGLLTRLSRETYTDPTIGATLEAHLRKAFEGGPSPSRPSFRDGAIASLSLASQRMFEQASQPFQSVEQSAWDDIGVSFNALREHKDQSVREAVLALLASAMRSGENAAMSTSFGRGIETLCALIDWSEREAGQALLSWFDDRSIPTSSLAPV